MQSSSCIGKENRNNLDIRERKIQSDIERVVHHVLKWKLFWQKVPAFALASSGQ